MFTCDLEKKYSTFLLSEDDDDVKHNTKFDLANTNFCKSSRITLESVISPTVLVFPYVLKS